MTYATLIYAAADGLAEIRLNRPERLNALGRQSYDELQDALGAAEADATVRAVLLTGEGRAFSAGADLKEQAAADAPGGGLAEREQALGRRLYLLPKPVIAAVNGFALGAGAEMAIACDFILMADDAKIGLPELGLGNFLGGGVSVLLPRLVGLAKARELVFLGEAIDAAEAVRIGLAHRRFTAEAFPTKARAFARQIADKAPLSLRLAKEQLNRAAERSFEAALTAEQEAMALCGATEDWQEGLAAFAAKRRPVFRGK